MFEREEAIYDRLYGMTDYGTITFSCEEAELLKDMVAKYLEWGREFGEVDIEDMVSCIDVENGDYVLSDTGVLGGKTAVSQFGKDLGTFDSEEDAVRFVKERMQKESFYPGMWKQDDHGGFTLIKGE